MNSANLRKGPGSQDGEKDSRELKKLAEGISIFIALIFVLCMFGTVLKLIVDWMRDH